MAEAASTQQAAIATREDTSQQRAGRRRRTSAEPQRAQQGATAAAAPAALDTLSRLQQLADASPQVSQLRRLQALADASPQAAQLRRLQALADNHHAPVAQLAGDPEEEELIQGNFASTEVPPQRQQAPRANNTGLPDQLKSGIESLSGLSMDHVRVHYNSAQPAQLDALAYAQGSDIHLAPGQEQHLPHEAWHVVQQAQGRVRPTLQLKDGVQVNDDVGLEREADVMGSKPREERTAVQARTAVPVQLAGDRQEADEGSAAQLRAAAVQCTDKVAQRTIVPGTGIDVDNTSRMPTWTQGGATYHINTSSGDTNHVTREGIPKVQFFFTGTGTEIRDQRPTKKEQGGASTKKVKKKGEKTKKIKTKCVFSELPNDVQNFVKNNWVAIFDA